MARNLMIALGVVLWGTFAVAATSLYLIGHWIAPTVTLDDRRAAGGLSPHAAKIAQKA